jgi:hypothetical protein
MYYHARKGRYCRFVVGTGRTNIEGEATLLRFRKLLNSAYMGKFCQFVFRIFEVRQNFMSIYLPHNIMAWIHFLRILFALTLTLLLGLVDLLVRALSVLILG